MEKTIYELQINESSKLEGSGYFDEVLRVPGGFIYSGLNKHVFIPCDVTKIKTAISAIKKSIKTTQNETPVKEDDPITKPNEIELPDFKPLSCDTIPEPVVDNPIPDKPSSDEDNPNVNDYDNW